MTPRPMRSSRSTARRSSTTWPGSGRGAPGPAVIAATMPVVFGMIVGGLPSPPVMAGIGLALVAVVLVSRVPGIDGARSGIEFGLVGGVGIGSFNILIGELPHGQ